MRSGVNIGGVMVLIWVLAIIGWVANIVRLVNDCDFESPYKCEVIRGIGVPVAIVGAVAGYINIEDGRKNQ